MKSPIKTKRSLD